MKKSLLVLILGLFLLPLVFAQFGSTEGRTCAGNPLICENPVDTPSNSSFFLNWNTTQSDIWGGTKIDTLYHVFKRAPSIPGPDVLRSFGLNSLYTGDYQGINGFCPSGITLFGYQKHHESFSYNKFTIETAGNQVKFVYDITKNVVDCWKGGCILIFGIPVCETDNHFRSWTESITGEKLIRTISPGCTLTCPPGQQPNATCSACQAIPCGLTCPSGQQPNATCSACVAVCSAACTGYDASALACGTLPAACCSDPGAGCKTPLPECGTLAKGTACTSGGVCDATGQCACPAACNINPNTVACGASLGLPASCDAHASVCGFPNPRIGWKCDDPNQRCTNFNGIAACKTPDDAGMTCGTMFSVYSGNPSQVKGLYCDAYQDERHELCDSAANNCLPIIQGSTVPKGTPNPYPAKYEFKIAVDPDDALWYNLWFKFRYAESAGQTNPQINWSGSPGSNTGLYCFNCSVQPDPALAFSLSFNPAVSKEGLARLTVSNNNQRLFGVNNYARIKLDDLVNPGKSSGIISATENSDYAIIKLNAGNSGVCVSEDRQFVGKTGVGIAPNVRFSWNWIDTNENTCDSDKNGIYCDATQFLISTIQRLDIINQNESNGTPDSSLLDFNANLVNDGFSLDFVKDFDHHMMTLESSTPSYYYECTHSCWHAYLEGTPKLGFQVVGATTPGQLLGPGTYHVAIIRTGMPIGSGGLNMFLPIGTPAGTITIKLEKQSAPTPDNPLYWLPMDGAIGETARTGETGPSRSGYGTAFGGDSLPLTADTRAYSNTSPSSLRQIVSQSKTDFNKTNPIDQRGKLFSLNLNTNRTVFAPSHATPVAMKISSLNSSAQGFFSLRFANQVAVAVSSDQSIASWSGIAASPSACTGFNNQPLLFLKPDYAPGIDACTANLNSRGFLWPSSQEQNVVLQSVLYGPINQSIVLQRECNVGTGFISPGVYLPGNGSASAFDLGFSNTQNLKPETLQKILDLIKTGHVCQYSDNEQLQWYWNRQKLMDDYLSFSTDWVSFMQGSSECVQAP